MTTPLRILCLAESPEASKAKAALRDAGLNCELLELAPSPGILSQVQIQNTDLLVIPAPLDKLKGLFTEDEELSAIFENTPTVICLLNSKLQITRINRAGGEFVQRPPEELIGLKGGDLLGCLHRHEDPRGCGHGPECSLCPIRNNIVKTLDTGISEKRIKIQPRSINGQTSTRTWISLSTARITRRGEAHVLVCFADISEQQSLEQMLIQAQKMEAVGQLAGGIAHDFNNILGSIFLHLGLLQRRANIDKATADQFRSIENDAKRAANLTRQLLMFSRRSVLNTSLLSVEDVVRDMLKMIGRMIPENISLEHRRAGPSAYIKADLGMIEQVIINLAINSRDAMPQGGRFVIETGLIDLFPGDEDARTGRRPGTFCCIKLSDTGIGMDSATLARIYEPFFTTKEVGKGTGLGLSTVQGIIKQHNGWIEVLSEPGFGTQFTLYIPACEELPAPRDTESGPDALPRGTERILLVEDETNIRLAMKLFLEQLGYEVHSAVSGDDAKRVWLERQGKFDLVLTDMMLPGSLSGIELLQRLRQDNPHFAAIITTGYTLSYVQSQGQFPAGASLVNKPFEPPLLARQIRKSLDERPKNTP